MEDTNQQQQSQGTLDATSSNWVSDKEEGKTDEPPAVRVRIRKGEYRPRSTDHPSRHIFVSIHIGHSIIHFSNFNSFQPFPAEPANPLDVREAALKQELLGEANTFLTGPFGMTSLKLTPH